MSDIRWRSFNPDADGYKKTWVDRFINLKSRRTHTELEFSGRYDGISSSATMQDGCKGDRFKFIDYTKHPDRWESITIPCTDEQEDAIFALATVMAGVSPKWPFLHERMKGIFFGDSALKYDKIGVVLCNILSMRLIRSRKRWIWCTESCIRKVLAGHPGMTKKHPDEFNPDNGHELVKEYFDGEETSGKSEMGKTEQSA